MREFALILLLFAPAITPAQVIPDLPGIFPSDSRKPDAATARELLEAVCPGRVVTADEPGCSGPCPPFTSFGVAPDNLPWSIEAITFGHFLSPASDDVAMAMQGCEPHSENFGGSILLTRDSKRWKMGWYEAGVITNNCRKVARADGREILVCIGEYGAQGNSSTDLYVEDLLRPAPTMMASSGDADGAFLSVADNMNGCPGYADQALENQPYTLMHGTIRRVDFRNVRGKGPPSIFVVVEFGERRVNATEAEACSSVKPAAPPVKTWRIRFGFSGSGYTAARGSAPLLRMMAGR